MVQVSGDTDVPGLPPLARSKARFPSSEVSALPSTAVIGLTLGKDYQKAEPSARFLDGREHVGGCSAAGCLHDWPSRRSHRPQAQNQRRPRRIAALGGFIRGCRSVGEAPQAIKRDTLKVECHPCRVDKAG